MWWKPSEQRSERCRRRQVTKAGTAGLHSSSCPSRAFYPQREAFGLIEQENVLILPPCNVSIPSFQIVEYPMLSEEGGHLHSSMYLKSVEHF